MGHFKKLCAFLLLILPSLARAAQEQSLAGEWRVLLDRQNNGLTNKLNEPGYWSSGKEPATVKLPGSIQSQKIGDLPAPDSPWTARIGLNMLRNAKYAPYQKQGDAGGFKTPFWLTPDRVYVGSAWYEREIDIPAAWKDQRITLFLERTHWETTVWIDGKQVGTSHNSLSTPHIYDLTETLATLASSTGNHTLVIRVDNSLKIPVGNDASAVTDQTQSNWNGIVGEIKLAATPKVWLDDVQIYPDLPNKKIKVKISITNQTSLPGKAQILLSIHKHGTRESLPSAGAEFAPISWDATGGTTEFIFPLGPEVALWDEFSPTLYDLTATIAQDTKYTDPFVPQDSRTLIFGMRELSTKGTQLLLNNKPLFLRGTLDCCIFPLTGYPPTGPEGAAYWKKMFTQLKAFGLNHLRCHSWCPPEIAFEVADEMGVYLQVEAGVWAAFGTGNALDQWIGPETDAMLKAYGNHPSFIMLSTANEPGSRTNQPNATFLGALCTKWKAADPRHLYTAGSNWPNVPEADYQVMSRPRMNGSGELTRPPQTESDYRAIVAQYPNQPVISHETGQWCVYPNFDEIKKYTGTLHPGNLEIFQDFLNKSGMGDQAHDFLMASGKFQALLYKEEIEALLRTPNIGGFQLLDLHDFPGQGTAPVGVLDAFWDEKPYITAAEYKRFAGPTVPLALLPKRIFTTDETPIVQLKVSHFGPEDLPAAAGRGIIGTTTHWRIADDKGNTLREGAVDSVAMPAGKLTDIQRAILDFPAALAPAKLSFQMVIQNVTGEAFPATTGPSQWIGPTFSNDWDIWVYPTPDKVSIQPADGIRIAKTLDDATLAFLNTGGKVLLLPGSANIAGNTQGSFAPIFWNRITFPTATYHTLSILCDPKNPAFADFPTDFYSNWQWSDLLQPNRCKPMLLGDLPKELKPIVQFIDDWDQARKLGLIIEAKVGTGKLLLCSIDLDETPNARGGPVSARPVARQLQSSLLKYMATPLFTPTVTLDTVQVKSLLR